MYDFHGSCPESACVSVPLRNLFQRLNAVSFSHQTQTRLAIDLYTVDRYLKLNTVLPVVLLHCCWQCSNKVIFTSHPSCIMRSIKTLFQQ